MNAREQFKLMLLLCHSHIHLKVSGEDLFLLRKDNRKAKNMTEG